MGDFAAYASLQVTTASISFVASTLISAMVAKSRQEPSGNLTIYSSPYHRIILGISISDLISSIGMMSGPFAPPRGVAPHALWAVGTDATCKADGFFVTFGSGCVPLYTCALCYYCFCKIRKNMSDDTFAHSIEWKLHAAIITYNTVLCTIGLVTNSMHTSLFGSVCIYSAFPAGCRQEPELYGECDKRIEMVSTVLSLLWALGLVLCCLVGIIFSMSMISWHVMITRDRVFQGSAPNFGRPRTVGYVPTESVANSSSYLVNVVPPEGSSSDPSSSSSSNIVRVDEDVLTNGGSMSSNDPAHLVKFYKREFMVQGCLFVATFFVTYIFAVVGLVMGVTVRDPPLFVRICFGTFYPLGGFFNILVFTRPKVMSLMKIDKKYSYVRAFTTVLMAGGTVPSHVTQQDTDRVDLDKEKQNMSKDMSYSIDDISFSNGCTSCNLKSGADSSGMFALSSGYLSSVQIEEESAAPVKPRGHYSGMVRREVTPLTPDEEMMAPSSSGSSRHSLT